MRSPLSNPAGRPSSPQPGAGLQPRRRRSTGAWLLAVPLLSAALPALAQTTPAGGAAAAPVQPAAPKQAAVIPTAAAAPSAAAATSTPTPKTTPAAAAAPAAKPAATATPPTSSTPSPATGAGLTSKERELLERINQLKATPWRTYGACRYNWGAWKLSDGGVRYTTAECGVPPQAASIAVHCDTLKVNRRVGDEAWGGWRLPRSQAESSQQGGEDRMVAALCANVSASGEGTAASGTARSNTAPPTPAVKSSGGSSAGGKASSSGGATGAKSSGSKPSTRTSSKP